MRALIMTDTHAQGQDFSLPKETFDCLLLCGDNAETSPGLAYHHKLFQDIRDQFTGPVGFIAGNHDLWTVDGLSSWELLYRELPEMAAHYGMTYLENHNLSLEGWTIAGTYGHYDYSLGNTSLEIAERGWDFVGFEQITWVDRKAMRWGTSDAKVCKSLLDNFENRLYEINREKLLTLSHTIPNQQLSGHPVNKLQRFFLPYSGSKRLEDVLRQSGGVAHYCGHTHAKAETEIGHTRCTNIGNGYGGSKYAIFDSEQFRHQENIFTNVHSLSDS